MRARAAWSAAASALVLTAAGLVLQVVTFSTPVPLDFGSRHASAVVSLLYVALPALGALIVSPALCPQPTTSWTGRPTISHDRWLANGHGELVFVVEDDGQGFDADADLAGRGAGMKDMHERLEALGGQPGGVVPPGPRHVADGSCAHRYALKPTVAKANRWGLTSARRPNPSRWDSAWPSDPRAP